MSIAVALITVLLLAIVIAVISGPLRGVHAASSKESAGNPDLQAAREAKYREIRDAELDYRTGKLSLEDYQAIDRTLRAQALEILNQIEASEQQAED